MRQFRAFLARPELPEVELIEKEAKLGQVCWEVLGGGLPPRLELIPKRVIAKVIERESGYCQVCGEAATTVDHSGSG